MMKNVIILLEIRYAMLNDSYFIFKKSNNKIAFIQQTHKKIWIYALILISYYHSVYIKISFFIDINLWNYLCQIINWAYF